MSIPYPFKVCKECVGTGGGSGGGGVSITVDNEMSDTSENPVQNKAIKAYVDDTATDIRNKHVTKTEFDNNMQMIGMDVTQMRTDILTINENIGSMTVHLSENDVRLYNLENNMGDIETALDGIIAMQNELIGGDA